ncbi:cilia- and flagella-associated protein 57 isoform X3 [Amia ocellicauda]|uniref:cilia- and flagella-associated protein 57 isoform X3 n=1 Tax=Amia ocellicauda TaxID=2972642 RepID=UPI003464AF17
MKCTQSDNFQDQLDKAQRVQEMYKERLRKMQERHSQDLNEMAAYYESKLLESQLLLEQSQDKTHQQLRQCQQSMIDMEEEMFSDIMEVRLEYEDLLEEERTKVCSLQDEIDECDMQITDLQTQQADFQDHISYLEEEIQKREKIIRDLETAPAVSVLRTDS